MIRAILNALSVVAVLTLPTPARAGDTVAPPVEDGVSIEGPAGTSLDVNLRLGADGFRLGGRVFDRGGYAGGAWLNAETRRDGFSLDGRLEHGGRAHNFRFNADLDAWVKRAWRLWGITDL
jgi:hypothetical protein